MSDANIKQMIDDLQATADAKAAEKRSSDMVHSELRSAMRPIMDKLEAIEERLINLENAIAPKAD